MSSKIWGILINATHGTRRRGVRLADSKQNTEKTEKTEKRAELGDQPSLKGEGTEELRIGWSQGSGAWKHFSLNYLTLAKQEATQIKTIAVLSGSQGSFKGCLSNRKKKKKKWLPFETNFRCPCLSPFWGGRWMKLVLVTPLCPPTDSLPLYPENIMQSLSLINTINSKRVSSRINTLSIKFCSAQEEIKICVDRKKIRNWIKYKSKCSIFYFLKITRLC